ncbi:helix-turn-helix domain-containing protein, partial [Candidatus Saccharibacteria bacterium]|nr:helix-turn-helix domain-containing protein [Candidatus Saccharibacteria bacterium]
MSPEAKSDKKSFLHVPSVHDLTVAELLKSRREELEQTLKEVETNTQIRKRYLELIEAGDYEHLPDDVYTLGYVKSYADHLGYDTAPIVSLYKKERLVYKQSRQAGGALGGDGQMSLRPLGGQSFSLSSKSLVIVFSVFLFLIILSYLGWQVAVLAAPPKITLNNNQERVVANFVIISGQTDNGADVYIDDSPILTNSDGSFSERVALVDGPNQIKITAKNRLGKTASISKTVTATLVKGSSITSQVSVVPIDGVEMLVKISNQATWVIVKADGQDIFRGTMLPGTQQIFKAKTSIKLTT